MSVDTSTRTRTTVTRWLPLAGVGFALLQVAGDLTIGEFPGLDTSPARLQAFYATHHAQVYAGGRLLEISATFLALLGVALWMTLRHTAPVVAAVALVGATMSAMESATSGATYSFLGDLGTERGVTPEALQAWHVVGAGFGVFAGTLVLLLAVGVAGAVLHAVPAWLGWFSLVLFAAQLSPFGFLASLVFLLWAAATGIAMSVRARRDDLQDVNGG